jgi:hypothetical protein
VKLTPARAALCCALLVVAAGAAEAQDFTDVKKYAVDVRLDPAAHAADVRTTMTIANPVPGSPKRRVTLRINSKAEVKTVTLAGQPATFTAEEDKRYPGLQVVIVTLPAPIAGAATGDLTVDARLTLESAAYGAAILPGETVLLPSSHWVPFANTEYTQYGANTAPVTLTAAVEAGERAISGGAASGATFTQPLHSLPFLVAGSFDAPLTASAGGVAFETWLPAGSPPEMRAGAERLLGEAQKIAAFYAGALGDAPQAQFKIIAADRAAGFLSPSGVAFGTRVFARGVTDAETFELLADGIARVWVGGGAAVRGTVPGPKADQARGVAVVGDALPRYLAVLALGSRYGAPAEQQAFDRMRVALARMGAAGAQVQLSLATPLEATYRGLITTRGPLSLRIVEREVGRDKMLAGIRDALAAARAAGWLTAGTLRAGIEKAAGRDVSAVYAAWFDTIIEPDLIIGVPRQASGAWASALRNLGTGDVNVDALAVTASGKRLIARVSVPSEGFGEARWETAEQVTAVEVDPDHVIIQTDYSNDARPPRASDIQLFNDAVAAYQRNDFAGAEAKLREMIAADPNDAVARAWHGRALMGLGRAADAEREAKAALAVEPVPIGALAWSHVVLGQAAAAGGRAGEAVEHFRRASAAAVETPALIAARQGLIEAERAAGQAQPVDESVRKFFAEFDRAVSAGVNTAQAAQFVDQAALPDFVRGLVTGVGRKWSTEVVHTEPAGAGGVLVDARFTVGSATSTSTAPAIVRLERAGGSWRIVEVQLLGV